MIGTKVVLQRGKERKRGFNGREGEIVAASRKRSAWAGADADPTMARNAPVRCPDLNADCIQSVLAHLGLSEVIRVASTSRAWMNAALAHAEHAREQITLVSSARSQAIDRHRQFCSKLGCDGFVTRVGMIKFNAPIDDMADLRSQYDWDANLAMLRLSTSMKGLDAIYCTPGARAREVIYQSRSLHVLKSLGSTFPYITQLKVRFDCTEDSMKALLQLRNLKYLVLDIIRDEYNAIDIERSISCTVSGLASLKAFSLRTTLCTTPLRLNIKSASLESVQISDEKKLQIVSMECPRMRTIRIVNSCPWETTQICPIIAEGCRNMQEVNLGTNIVLPSEFNLLNQCYSLRVANLRIEKIRSSGYGSTETRPLDFDNAHLVIEFPRIVFLRLAGSPIIASLRCPLLEIALLRNNRYDSRSQNLSVIEWAEVSREQVFVGSNRLKLVEIKWASFSEEACAFLWCQSLCGSHGEGIWYYPFAEYCSGGFCISCGDKFQNDADGVIARCSGARRLPSGHAWKCQDLLESMKIRDCILESGIPSTDAEHKSSLKFCCVG